MKILKNIQNRRKDTTIYWSIKEELKNGIVRRIRKIFTFISDSVLSSNKNCEWKLRVGFMWARIGDEDLKWGRSECKSMMRRQLTYASFQTIFFFLFAIAIVLWGSICKTVKFMVPYSRTNMKIFKEEVNPSSSNKYQFTDPDRLIFY